MPTGYTADVQSGKITEFKEFALQCSRAMDKPIPDEFEPDSFYKNELEEIKSDLAKMNAMAEDEIIEATSQHNADEVRRFNERLQENAEQRARYETMLLKAADWTPPTEEHAWLKEFMISQLQELIKFDCSYKPDEPKAMTPTEWLNSQRNELQRRLEHYSKSLDEEVESAAKRTAWVKALKKSLEQ